MPTQHEGRFSQEEDTKPEKLRIASLESKLPQGTTVEYHEDERTQLRLVELTLPEHNPLPLPEVMSQIIEQEGESAWRFTEPVLANAHIIAHRNVVFAANPSEFTQRYNMQAIRLRSTDTRAQDWHFEPKATTVDNWVITAHGPVESGNKPRQVPTRVATAAHYLHSASQTLEIHIAEIAGLTATPENAHFLQGLVQALEARLDIFTHLAPGAKSWKLEDYKKVLAETGLVPGSREAQVAAVLFSQYKWQNLLPTPIVKAFEAALQPSTMDVPWTANTALFVHNSRSVHAQGNYPSLIQLLSTSGQLANQPQIIALQKKDLFGSP